MVGNPDSGSVLDDMMMMGYKNRSKTARAKRGRIGLVLIRT